MQKRNIKVAAFIGSVLGTAALTGAAVMGTGAYFQDSEAGTVTASMGSIDVAVENQNLSFQNMLPGQLAEDSGRFKNVGKNAQDVYLVANQQLVNQVSGVGTLRVNGSAITGGAVKLASNLQPNESIDYTVQFTPNSTLGNDFQNLQLPAGLGYQIVATQVGVARG